MLISGLGSSRSTITPTSESPTASSKTFFPKWSTNWLRSSSTLFFPPKTTFLSQKNVFNSSIDSKLFSGWTPSGWQQTSASPSTTSPSVRLVPQSKRLALCNEWGTKVISTTWVKKKSHWNLFTLLLPKRFDIYWTTIALTILTPSWCQSTWSSALLLWQTTSASRPTSKSLGWSLRLGLPKFCYSREYLSCALTSSARIALVKKLKQLWQ